jgi:WD40 repeat protein
MRTDNRGGTINFSRLNGAGTSPKDKLVQEKTISGNQLKPGMPWIQSSADGARVIFGLHGFMGAVHVDHSEISEAWPVQRFSRGDLAHKLHPTKDLVWAGERVLKFSSGEEISVIKRKNFEQFKTDSAVWIESNRVAEILIPPSGPNNPGELSESDIKLALWDTQSGELILTKEATQAAILCASPDGLHIAEGGNDRRVRIRNSRTLEIEREFRVHEDAVVAIAWHPTKPLLVTGSKNPLIRIWDLGNVQKVEEIKAKVINGRSLNITIDGLELSVTATDGSIKVYKPKCFEN